MRITQNMYYKSLYGTNNSQLQTKLFDVNKQIASGIKIQYANEDVAAFTETMRLDNEVTTLEQIKKSTQSGYKVSNQTDVALNEFETSMNRMRTLLLQAANGTNDAVSLDAIAAELRGQESHLKNLANTSINGQYLFSGSAVDIKPISADGTYNGNDATMNSFLGLNAQQEYNISGAELFLGEEQGIRREITTNVTQTPNVGTASLSGSTTMAEFMGTVPGANQHSFYLRGTQSDGTSINEQIQLNNTDSVDSLLAAIGTAYGNASPINVVNVTMNDSGHITVADKIKGSSKLDFHLVGASSFDVTDDYADIGNAVYGGSTKIDLLATTGAGTTNYATASAPSATGLYIREFNKSGLTAATGAPSVEGLVYDRNMFNVSGNKVTSNIPQINKTTNAFATPSTKLSEVADLSQGTADTLDGTQLIMNGTRTSGGTFTLQVDLKNTANGGTTFSLDGGTTNYNLYDVGTPRAAVDADEMTYQQLMDVMNLAVTGTTLPATTTNASQYDSAIEGSQNTGRTYLSHDGKVSFSDLQFQSTQASIGLYDANSGDFASGSSSVLTFNTNNSLTIRDPKTDYFKSINEMIRSVENHILYPDHTVGNQRSVGIENAIAMMDDIQDHIFSSHSRVGANSNALTSSLERTEILEISTKTLRSQVIDTDLAEASLALTQLTLNYEAMLSTVGRVSQLSLVNYL